MLNQRQERFLKALLETPSIEQACKLAEINKNTGYKYLKDETFMKEYRAIRRELMQQVTAKLQKSSEDAVHTLNEVMFDSNATPSSRVQAAKNILEIAYRSLELDDIQERVDAIESRLANEKKI
ncbi:phage replication protein [Vagococcus carniphilus]|uniref:phage replication protein n=1 Tax=Vagococcus carniphilus TaxID=218144 RepID=UPI00288C8819|nr:phage replication protein [Vagococcus carniphilus]MDT2831889.1 phage replication protein [Vagococcus carniphilus]MDT2839303.1 phage replication protein [Vagococcus carniphilus]MDT2855399.1 phage replication protein [Vagococcus carniphilus]